MPGSVRASALVAGYLLDTVFADPERGHPVAIFGSAAGALERRIWADSRVRGTVFTGLCIVPVTAIGGALERAARRPGNRLRIDFGLLALSTWTVLGAQGLVRAGQAVQDRLDDDDLAGARQRLTHLVGRDPSGLDEAEIVRAAVESIAENTSDAVVAPLLWGAVLGVPGLLGYRVVNTLDAMVGHRSRRYLRFGWASARLDDVANLVPARVTVALTALAAPVVGGSPRAAWTVARRDGADHPSPNSGHCEAAFAGALGRRLGGTNVYGTRTEHRPTLGDGHRPDRGDLNRAGTLSIAVGALATALSAGLAIGLPALTLAARRRVDVMRGPG